MRIDILTLFPEMFVPLTESIIGRAVKSGKVEIVITDIRDYTENKHRKCDDYPFGGGAGMVMTPQPVYSAINAVDPNHEARRIFMSPKGRRFCQGMVKEMLSYDRILLLCGHYEGIDQRVLDLCVDEEISLGDFVLTGGEIPAMAITDCVCRYIGGVISTDSLNEESFTGNLLEYPQYTRPEVWEGRAVPQVLLGGDHQKIDAWRGEQSRTRTRLRRPELYEQWCETHPITELPKWKRGENVRLVKTEEQFRAAAQLFSEGRRDLGRGCWAEEGLAEWTPEYFYDQLKEEKAQGWACYLHYTKNEPDGMISVDHKGGRIEHLFIAASARGKGIGQKMLDFARKKLPEHPHPTLTVLDKNTRALALYRRMGWKVCGVELVFDPAKDRFAAVHSELLVMRYEG